jgi:hypothetical protein
MTEPRGHFQNGTPWCDLTPSAAVEAASPERHIGCKVCHHAERVRIEALKVAGVSLDKLAAQFGIRRDAIHRHCKNHLTERARISYLAGPAAIADLANAAARENRSVLEYLTVIRSVLMQQFTESAAAGKAHTAANVAGHLVTVLQTLGKVTGEISALASTSITVTNNVQILNSQPFIELQTGLLSICQKHPEARADIIALFRQLDERHAAPAAKMIEECAVAE